MYGPRPQAAGRRTYSRPRAQFFSIRTDLTYLFIYLSCYFFFSENEPRQTAIFKSKNGECGNGERGIFKMRNL